MNQAHFPLQKPSPGPALVSAPRRRFRKRWIVFGLLGGMAGGLAVLAVLAVWTFLPGGDVRAIQQALGAADGRPAATQVAFRVGWPVLMPARWVASLAKADEEVVDALRTVRRAEVCIRENASPVGANDLREAFAAADIALHRRGLERVVGVYDRGECVGVYVPRNLEPAREIRLTVFVVNRRETVIVSAACSTPDLMRLVDRQTETASVNRGPRETSPTASVRALGSDPGPGVPTRRGRPRDGVASGAETSMRTPLCVGPAIL